MARWRQDVAALPLVPAHQRRRRDIVGGGHGVAAGSAGAIRPASLGYLAQVARAADQLGFEAVLTPTGAWCEDAWLTTAVLTEVTERLKFLVAFRPGLISPTLAAQMASTFQRYSWTPAAQRGDRRRAAEQRAYGDFLDKEQRYQRCAEFLDIVRRLWRGETVSHDGEHLHEEGARVQAARSRAAAVLRRLVGRAGPVAARHADVYLTWGEPPAAVRRSSRMRDLARQAGAHAAVRDPTARHRPRHRGRGVAAGRVGCSSASTRRSSRGPDRPGAQRVRGPAPDARTARRLADNLEVSPNLWAGVGLVRGGAGTALVGSHGEVADRIEEYADLGIATSSCPATRTSRRPTGSARACCRFCARGVWGDGAGGAVATTGLDHAPSLVAPS